MTYTEHKLTETQLRFLSQIVNERQRQSNSNTTNVLEHKGLIRTRGLGATYPRLHVATRYGREALAQARAEGW